MKSSLAVLGLAASLALPTFSSAASLQWNFINDVPSNSNGVAAGTTRSFKDTANDPATILASVSPATNGYQLFEKKGGGSENGLGITPGSENEINPNLPGVKLDLTNILAFHPGSISISLNSVQASETGVITYLDGDHDGDAFSFNITDSNAHSLDLSRLYEDGGAILVNASSGNVLVAGVTATTPEPAGMGALGLCLIAAGAMFRRKSAAKKA